MQRRQTLATIATVIAAPVAGCNSTVNSRASTPAGHTEQPDESSDSEAPETPDPGSSASETVEYHLETFYSRLNEHTVIRNGRLLIDEMDALNAPSITLGKPLSEAMEMFDTIRIDNPLSEGLISIR